MTTPSHLNTHHWIVIDRVSWKGKAMGSVRPSVCPSISFHFILWTDWPLNLSSWVCVGDDRSSPGINSQCYRSRSVRSVWPRSSIEDSFFLPARRYASVVLAVIMCPSVCHRYEWPLVTMKVTFAVWNLCVHSPLCFASTMVRWRSNMRCKNNVCGTRRWFITVTVQLTSARLVVRMSVDDTHGIACLLCDSYA